MKRRDDDGELFCYYHSSNARSHRSVLLPAVAAHCFSSCRGTGCCNSGLVFADADVLHEWSNFWIGLQHTLLAAVDSSVLLIGRKRPIPPTVIRWRGVSAAWRLHDSSALLALSDHHMLTPRTVTSLRTRDPHHCLFYSPLVCGPAGRRCSPHPIRNINLHPLQPGCTIRGLSSRILPGRKLCTNWGLGQKICKSWLTRRRRRRRRPSPSSFVLGHRPPG